MSLDLYLKSPECDKCGHAPGCRSFNYTYNVSPMWYAVFPGDPSMVYIDGMTGEESAPRLTAAISALEADPGQFAAMNPTNGWGSYSGFVEWLKELRDAALERPLAVWSSWR